MVAHAVRLGCGAPAVPGWQRPGQRRRSQQSDPFGPEGIGPFDPAEVPLAAITSAVAEPVAPTENSEETTARKALSQSDLEHNLQRRGPATAPVTDPTATALSEAEQRRVARVPDPFVPSPATATAANPSLEAPGGNLDALAALLLGLVGGLVGGAAAVIGWTISTRRRLPRTVAGT